MVMHVILTGMALAMVDKGMSVQPRLTLAP